MAMVTELSTAEKTKQNDAAEALVQLSTHGQDTNERSQSNGRVKSLFLPDEHSRARRVKNWISRCRACTKKKTPRAASAGLRHIMHLKSLLSEYQALRGHALGANAYPKNLITGMEEAAEALANGIDAVMSATA